MVIAIKIKFLRGDSMAYKDNYLFCLWKKGHAENRTYETVKDDSDAYEMAKELEKCLKLDKVEVFRQHIEWNWVGTVEGGELEI